MKKSVHEFLETYEGVNNGIMAKCLREELIRMSNETAEMNEDQWFIFQTHVLRPVEVSWQELNYSQLMSMATYLNSCK